jgi:phospholipase/carboxylesterase
MVLDVGLGLPVAGIASLSGFLHSKPQVSAFPLPPMLMAHGKQDSVVPIQAARQARDELVALGAKVQYQEFDMGHEIPMPVVSTLQDFLTGLGKL